MTNRVWIFPIQYGIIRTQFIVPGINAADIFGTSLAEEVHGGQEVRPK
jgi:hypothetical protein